MKKAFLLTLLFIWAFLNTTTLFSETFVLPNDISIYSFPTADLMVPCPGGPGTIGGNAFQDFNYNGLDDQLGARLDGIEVYLFSCNLSGESEQVATAITDENGDYFFSSLVDEQEYRVEFRTPTDMNFLASGFNETDSRTTVQFVTSPNCDVNIGLANPDDFCEEDPLLIIPCYVNGDPTATGSLSATEDAMVAFSLSDSGTNPKPISIAKAEEIGATWGVTYNKANRTIYTTAFLKRHVGLGPLGIGGIYQIDMNGANPVVSPLVDLAAIGANIGTFIDNNSRNLSPDINLPSNDAEAFDQVGKKGLGGLTMSADGNTLYIISLTDQTVYSLDISAGTTPTNANLKTFPIPDPGCTGGVFRPFAIQIHNEKLYVGGVCDAEMSGQKSDLRSIVYRLDGSTFTEVLNFSLDFQKGLASRSCDGDRGWFPWSSTVPESCFKSGASNIIVHPTPILSDIEFDGNGDMYLGYMDRIGNQLGYQNYGPVGQTELYSAFTGGDILKAGINEDGSFILENNGTVGPNTTVGADNGEGPGGGEFFSFDVFEVAPGIPRPHSETAQGALALIKGSNQVIGSSLDPFGTFVNSGGVNYWNIETGEVRDPGYVIFRSGSNSIATFSKANGLGDISTLCGAAPIELGGRLWVDANTNGVQDPCEGSLANIEVFLYSDNGTLLGTQTTDVNGEYYFSNTGLTTGLITPNTSYNIVIGSDEQTKTPLALLDIYTPTAKDLGMSPNNDLNDSDLQVGEAGGRSNALVIPIMTGNLGSVSHSNDAGFFEIPPPPVANISGQVFNDLNQNGLQGNNEPFIGGVKVTLFNTDGTIVATTVTAEDGQYGFEDIAGGDYYLEIDYETSEDGTFLNFSGSMQDAGNDAIDSDFDPITGQTNTIAFDPSAGDQDFDAGIFQPKGAVVGTTFEDIDGDGIQGDNEPIISGVSVTLQDCAGSIIDTTTTNQAGTYSFDQLVAGNYQVIFDVSTNSKQIDNYFTAPQDAGTDDTKDSDIDPLNNASACLPFDPERGIIVDAGFVQPTGTVIGVVKEDPNKNGVQEVDEPALGGILVRLIDCNGQEFASTTTDANGQYSFGDIIQGNYEIVFDASANFNNIDNYITSPQNVGTDDALDFDVDPVTNSSGCISFDPDKPTIIDAGFYQPSGALTGSVFEDLSEDGLQDANEPFIDGISIYLLDCAGAILDSTLTNANGLYSFENLLKGDYQILFGTYNTVGLYQYIITKQDVGTDDTIDSDADPITNNTTCIAFDPAQGGDFDAGYIKPTGTATGTVFEDLDGDGIRDPDEGALLGIEVSLANCDRVIIATTITNEDGTYTFEGLKEGDYQIVFGPPKDGFGFEYLGSPPNQGDDEALDSDIDPETNATVCITFAPNQTEDIDAGYFPVTGPLSGTAFEDTNKNGIQDPDEKGIEGVTVTLANCTGNAAATATTDAAGNYLFSSLTSGEYQIIFNPLTNVSGIDNYLTTIQNQGGNDKLDSDIDTTTNTSHCFILNPYEGADIDGGFFQPVGEVTGTTFEDVDKDGVQEADEPFIGGITVLLKDCNGTTIATTTTDPSGNYSFGDLLKDDYVISFDVSTNLNGITNYIPTIPNVGTNDAIDSDINSSGNSTCSTLDPDEGVDIDAGFIQPTGTITGTTFKDLDQDGIQDVNEPFIGGIKVTLMACNGTAVATTTTDANGNYTFGEIIKGNYIVVFDVSTNLDNIDTYISAPQNAGTNDAVDSDINNAGASECIEFNPDNGVDIDAGFIEPTGTITGTTFEDKDEDGIQEEDKTAIEGIKVSLMDCNGLTIATTLTDANGDYSFGDILRGNYIVVFDASANLNGVDNYRPSPQNIGTNEALDSDINANGSSDCITFDPDTDETVDAGFIEPKGAITGTTFEDGNKDGIQGVDEPNIGGVKVMLMDCNGTNIANTISDANGNYSFSEVLKGKYTLVFDVATNIDGINNYIATSKDAGTNDVIDSDINTNGSSDCIDFDPDKDIDIDAGYIQPTGTVTGSTFEDTDKDGIQDANESFIGGINVILMDCNGAIVAITTTDANGNYSFGDVLKGKYILSFDITTNLNGIDNYISAPKDAGTNDAVDSDINPTGASDCIDFDPDNGIDVDAGYIQPTGTVTGSTFDDTDGDGIQDVDEPFIGGIKVVLMDCNGATVATTTTDANGNYSFGDVLQGKYIISFDASTNISGIDNYISAPKDAGTNDAIDSDINANGASDCIDFDPDNGTDVDAGFVQPTGAITGSTFEDTDKDGIQDATEPFIGGIKVTLMDCNGATVATTTTDANGNYSFGDVLKGKYTIVFDVSTNLSGIDNYISAPKDAGTNDAIDSDITTTGASDCIDFNPDTGVDVDAGFIQPTGAIMGSTFEDSDKDGIQDANEPFIGGIKVTLMDCNGATVATTTTDANGNYSFGDVLKGKYILSFDVSTNLNGISNYISTPKDAGTNDAVDSDISTIGASDCIDFDPDKGLDVDAGYVQPTGIVTGTSFEDVDEDGIQDVDEPFIGGVTVTLKTCEGVTIATTTTDFNGNYSFGDLLKDSYIISFNVSTNLKGINNYTVSPQDVGTNDALDSDINATGDTKCIEFDPDTGSDIDAGFIEPTGDITGMTFEDLNEDGIRDPNEGGLPNIPVSLVDCDNNVIATTETDQAGNYSFGNIKKGDYAVVFGVPKDVNGFDYLISPKDVGTDDTKDSDINPSTKRTDCFPFDPTEGINTDIGVYPPTGELTGLAFEDTNKNGLLDNDEMVLENITVTLTNCNSTTPITTATTNATGRYIFDNLLSGVYQVSFNPSTNLKGIPDYTPTLQGVASNNKKNSDIHTITNASDCVTFDPTKGAEVDAGFFQPVGEIIGSVFEDLDVDGLLDIDDPGIVGVTINLLDCDGNIVSTTTTDFNGDYTFKDLPSGNYQVMFNTSTNVLGISNFFASPEGRDSDIRQISNDTECLPFNPEEGSDIDAGFFQPTGIIEGTAFQDMDHDGMQEPRESSIGGVTVRLIDCDNAVIATTTTDNNGNYIFDMVKAGNYQVVFDPSTNTELIKDYMTSPANRGDDTMDSDVDPSTNTTTCFTFEPMKDEDIDAGFYQPIGELMGTIFADINEDGMQDIGELGIPGVTVVLLDDKGEQVATTTANNNGNYFFTDVVSGNYQILVDPSSNLAGMNYINSPKDQGDDKFDSDINPADNRSDVFSFVAAVGGDIDGGFYMPAAAISIGDLVFKDCNKNGVFDVGESGLQGIIVMLSGTNDLDEVINMQATTNAAGKYRFNIDRPGTFRLTFIIPADLAGVEFSPQNVGTNDAVDSDADATGVVERIVVANGEQIDHVDVGLIDSAAPRIFNVPPDVTVSCDNMPDPPVSVKGVDNCDPSVTVSFKEEVIQAGCPATIVRTWTTADECGNSTQKQQTITVIDEEAPVITLSNPLLAGIKNGGEVTFDCDNMPEFDETDVLVTDNCDKDIKIEFVDLVRIEGDCTKDGFVVQMTCGWKAIDDCGNASEYVITITVVDTKVPTINNFPEDVTINLTAGQAIPAAATNVVATDNCDEEVSLSYEETQTEGGPCGYEIMRTWTARDNCGNKTSQTQTIKLLKDCTCPTTLTSGMMVQNAACDGSTGGMILLNLTADAQYYDFDFVPNLGEPNFLGNIRNNIPPGDYTVTITYKGAEDCKETHNISVGILDAAAITIADSKKADCFTANGFIALAPANFVYEWSDGIIAAQRSDLAAGTYKVNYTDNVGCKGSTTITVEEPANCACLNFKFTTVENTMPTCPRAADGKLAVTTVGGKEAIRYEWSNGAMGMEVSNLSAGMYTVTATDANGCQIQQELMVMDPESLAATISHGNGACGEKGMIDLYVRGGTIPYAYQWNTGAVTEDLLNVESGVYAVTIQDAHFCETTASVMINNGGNISIDLAKKLPSCNGSSDGAIRATISGGTAPYRYQWSNGAVTQNLSNIGKGAYSIVVTDANNCQSTSQIEVEESAELNLVLTPTLPGCSGGTGSIEAVITGGTAPYTYQWDFGATSKNVSNLAAGSYSVVITDANGCQAIGIADLDIPVALAAFTTIQNPSCQGALGAIELSIQGGLAPFQYQWDNGSTTKNIKDLAPNVYTVVVSDARGCTTIASGIISAPKAIEIQATTTKTICDRGGDISITVSNGAAPFTYQWSNGATTKNISNLFAGTYTGTVTDANACSALVQATVEQTVDLKIVLIPTLPGCGGGTGSINATVTGGLAPYTYAWDFGSTSEDVSGLAAGTYMVVVTDANNCKISGSATLDIPLPLAAYPTIQGIACAGGLGAIELTIEGGVAPFQYQWDNGNTTKNINNLTANVYGVVVTDARGCTAITSAIINEPKAIDVRATSTKATCDKGGDISISISNGVAPFTYQWSNGATTKDVVNVPAGSYQGTVTDANNCSVLVQAIIDQTSDLNVVLIPTLPGCDGGTGSINATVTGGLAPYTYAWDFGSTSEDVSGLAAGNYSLIITDANGCKASGSITLDIPLPLAVYTTIQGIACIGELGAINLTIEGGVAPFTYQWNFGGTSKNLTNLYADNYTVIVSDARGCTATTTALISEPPPSIEVTTTTTEAGCGNKGGDVLVSVINGKAPFTYKWNNGAITKDLFNVPAGTYEGTVTDATGCGAIFIGTVQSSASITGTAKIKIPSCVNAQDGEIKINFTGGTAPIQFKWNTGAITQNIANLKAGTYSLTITDAQSCQFVINATIDNPEPLVIKEVNQSSAICEAANGSLATTVSGGMSPYTYYWSNGATTDHLTGVVSGTYTLTVTDSKSCTATQTFSIGSDCTCPAPLYTTVMLNKAKCGESNGAIMVVVDHPERYTYEWFPNVGIQGQNTNERINLPSGNYDIRITYANQDKCSEIINVFLGNLEPISSSIVSTIPADCDQDNGQVQLAPENSIYQWSDGLLGNYRKDLAAGYQTVQVTDVNGCKSTLEVTVRREACLDCNISATAKILKAPTCASTLGDIIVEVTGGTTPMKYTWDIPNVGNNPHVENLAAGTYHVTVVDANGCGVVSSVEVVAPNCGIPEASNCTMILSMQTVNTKCAGESNGTVGVNVLDGKGPFLYAWSNGQYNQHLTDVSAGHYTVIVTDAKNCTATASAEVKAPAPVSFTHYANFLDCDKVTVSLAIEGGTKPYKWMCNGLEGSEQDNINLVPGTYTCTVMDNSWCSSEQVITVNAINDPVCIPPTNGTTQGTTSNNNPFKFTSFTLNKLSEAAIALAWTTANETESGNFLIQHSTDGLSFEVIGNMVPANGPIPADTYQRIMDLTVHGFNYFQIKYVDDKGASVLSSVQEVFKKLPREIGRALLYPNPIIDKFTIDFLVPTPKDKQLIITNSLGTTTEVFTIPAGTIKYELDAKDYRPGIYNLVVDNQIEKDIVMRLVKVEW